MSGVLKSKKVSRFLFAICSAVLLFVCGFLVGVKYEKLEYLRVVDGDTFWVRDLRDNSEWKVRLWGVDAPEQKECNFQQSSDILEKYLKKGTLRFEKFGRDGYGRILAKVYVEGESIEEIMIAVGAAKVYGAENVHDELKPDKEYLDHLKIFEEVAKSEGLGVWSGECAE